MSRSTDRFVRIFLVWPLNSHRCDLGHCDIVRHPVAGQIFQASRGLTRLTHATHPNYGAFALDHTQRVHIYAPAHGPALIFPS